MFPAADPLVVLCGEENPCWGGGGRRFFWWERKNGMGVVTADVLCESSRTVVE